jgi:hypothetical protein
VSVYNKEDNCACVGEIITITVYIHIYLLLDVEIILICYTGHAAIVCHDITCRN